MTNANVDRTRGQGLRAGGDDLRARQTPLASLVATVDREQQLFRLLDHFKYSVDQASRLLDCTTNTIYTRRQGARPERPTALDARIDQAYFLVAGLEEEGFEASLIRDWTFSRSEALEGEWPVELLVTGDHDRAASLFIDHKGDDLADRVARDRQLHRLDAEFKFSVDQLKHVLQCTTNTIYNRRKRPRPDKHTSLDGRIDDLFFICTSLHRAGLVPETVRDWLFARTRYFDGDTPADRLAKRQWKLVHEAGRCVIAGMSTQDFHEHLDDIGLTDEVSEVAETHGTLHPMTRTA